MPTRPSIPAFLLAVTLLAASPAPGQEVDPSELASESVALQIDRLNRTLVRIADLLERQTEAQRLELGLQRVELASRRVETLESELARARAERARLEDGLLGARSHLDSLVSQIEQSDPAALNDLEAMTRQIEPQVKVVEGRIQRQDHRILELENELTRRRQDLEALEAELERHLGRF